MMHIYSGRSHGKSMANLILIMKMYDDAPCGDTITCIVPHNLLANRLATLVGFNLWLKKINAIIEDDDDGCYKRITIDKTN